jgi:hypothetical protein
VVPTLTFHSAQIQKTQTKFPSRVGIFQSDQQVAIRSFSSFSFEL